jgi:hypothetical protein
MSAGKLQLGLIECLEGFPKVNQHQIALMAQKREQRRLAILILFHF